MSPRRKLAAISGAVVVIGAALLVFSNGDGILVVLGEVVVAAGIGNLAASQYTHRPSRRLPEPLRPSEFQVSTLVLRDGQRITAIAVFPGGYVRPRKSDPRFDARQVESAVPASEEDFETERKRQRPGTQ